MTSFVRSRSILKLEEVVEEEEVGEGKEETASLFKKSRAERREAGRDGDGVTGRGRKRCKRAWRWRFGNCWRW